MHKTPTSLPIRNRLQIRAGQAAQCSLLAQGLKAENVVALPAAAGGPKGLILNDLDQWLAQEWLAQAPRTRVMIGSSIGAWRAACFCSDQPKAAFQALAHHYIHQTYSEKPTSTEVAEQVRKMMQHVFTPHKITSILTHPYHKLQVLANRGRAPLRHHERPQRLKAAFAQAALANLTKRERLASYLERWIFSSDTDCDWLHTQFDGFDTHTRKLTSANFEAALIASGSIPLVIDPVLHIPSADPGPYWDGGLIDYHLHLPYSRLIENDADIVLYPHFTQQITPGWLDKSLPWRKARGSWLDHVLLIAPSKQFIANLPRKKIPDRQDFPLFGLNHQERFQAWQRDIQESQGLTEALQHFIADPTQFDIEPL